MNMSKVPTIPVKKSSIAGRGLKRFWFISGAVVFTFAAAAFTIPFCISLPCKASETLTTATSTSTTTVTATTETSTTATSTTTTTATTTSTTTTTTTTTATTAALYWITTGPIASVNQSLLAGWTQCYSDTFNVALGNTPSTALSQCTQNRLLLACRQVSSTVYTLIAMGYRSDVLYDTGGSATTTHVANNVAWYYHAAVSWGFASPADSVNLNQCDTNSANYPQYRLCWHLLTSTGGYRCGATTGLNSDSTWAREVWQAN